MNDEDGPTFAESVISLVIGAILALLCLLVVVPWLDMGGR